MKKRMILFLFLLTITIYQLGLANSQVGVGIQITEFDCDKDGIPDSTDPDDDNDGILDENDFLCGNSSFVQSSTVNVNLSINSSINLTQIFNTTLEVVIKDVNVTLVNFSWNFTEKVLNFRNVTIERQTIANKGSTLVSGITLTSGRTKTFYVDRIANIDSLCIKDAQIDRISEISSNCTGANETLIECPSSNGYNCTKVENGTRFKVDGLNFSGIVQQDTRGPTVTILSPIPKSGSFNRNVTFAYLTTDPGIVDNCSLIINDRVNLTNTSITENTRIIFKLNNLPIGVSNWSINCTDNSGNVGDSLTRKLTVHLMTKFQESGATTNVSGVNNSNLSNFVIDIPSFGKINFSEAIDISQGFDFDNNINISSNRIELNSTALPALNKSATLQLYGLTFTDPRILRDGAVCPSSICTEISYTGGNLIFNVTQFSVYSSEETPAEAAPAPSGGGGAGGGGGGGGGGTAPPIPIVIDFSVDKTTLKVVLKQGQTKEETLSIKNIGTTIFDVKAYLKGIEKFKISPEVGEIIHLLNPDEEKTIRFVFKALENEKPDIYTGKIVLKSPSIEKEINTLIEVDSAEPLFDVDVEVLSDSKKILPGEELLLEVNLFNVRGFGRVDVVVDYSIKDLKGNIVASEHETLAVETQAKFTRALTVPSDLRPGNYVAVAKVTYADSIGTSSDLFEVTAKTIRLYSIQFKDYKVVLSIGAIILIAGVIVFSAYHLGYVRKKMPKTKADETKQLQMEDKAQKLRKEIEALESAYKSGFISAESYEKDKKRIGDKLNKLR